LKDFKEFNAKEKILNGTHTVEYKGKLIEEGNYVDNNKSGTWHSYYYDQNVRIDYEYDSSGIISSESYYDLNKNIPFSGEFIYKAGDSDLTEERNINNGYRNGATRYKDANDKTIKKESYKDGVLKV
ncbi:MAG: hypothetical protein C0412_15295, partial [Flavobacterium sp.]|nr:hypothetical protein [Flavobacterium sp.]